MRIVIKSIVIVLTLLFVGIIGETLLRYASKNYRQYVQTKTWNRRIKEFDLSKSIDAQNKMKLLVLSDYGEKESIISENPTSERILNLMNSLDWNLFHQVILEQGNGDFIEVGGNLKEDGLSSLYEEEGRQYVTVNPPRTVDEMTTILILYLNNDASFKPKYQFE